MKIQIGITVLMMALSFAAGIGFYRLRSTLASSSQGSLAGQTLVELSRAIEAEREIKGTYPDSIVGLNVTSASGDFSRETLSKIIYCRSGDTFVAFVGIPGVAYIRPGMSAQFVENRPGR